MPYHLDTSCNNLGSTGAHACMFLPRVNTSMNAGFGIRITTIHGTGISWVAVKELKLSYYIEGTLLFTIYYIYPLW